MVVPPSCSTLFPYTTLFRSIPLMVERLNRRNADVWRFGHSAIRSSCSRLTRRELLGLRIGRARPTHSAPGSAGLRSEEHTSELQSLRHLVCRLLLEKKKKKI